MSRERIRRVIVGALIAMMIATVAVGCGDSSDDNSEKEMVQTEEPQEVTPESTPEPAPVPEPKIETNQEELEDEALEMMRDSYEGIAEVRLDRESSIFVVTPHSEAIATGAMGAKEGNPELRATWDDMVDSFAGMSGSLSTLLGGGYTVAVANPLNSEKILIVATDGVVIYDFVVDETGTY